MERLGSIDLGAHFFFQSLPRTWWLDRIMAGFTYIGDAPRVLIVGGLFLLFFLAAKRPRTALALLLSGCLGISISESVKRLVDRKRPPDVVNVVVEKPNSPSFPSGHSLGSASVYGAIGLGMAQFFRGTGSRSLVIALGFFLSFLIGLSRLYLGVHFLFDVLGGWTAGTACALLGHWLDRSFSARGLAAPAAPPAANPQFN